MKRKILFAVLLAALCLSACGKKPASSSAASPAVPPAASSASSSASASSHPASSSEEDDKNKDKSEATLYLPDANAETLIPTETMIPAPTEANFEERVKAAVVELADMGALPLGSSVNSVEDGKVIALDMNAAFGEGFCHTGTAGETMYLGALVNSILAQSEQSAEHVLLTIDGEVPETGHNIYDEPIGMVK